MTIKELFQFGFQELNNNDRTPEETRYEVRLLLSHYLHLSTAALLTRQDEKAPQDALEAFLKAIARRKNDEPIAYILGEWEFMGIPINLNSSTLIPRQDTELLAETAIEEAVKTDAPIRILDLCTGSGCIIISLGVHIQRLRPQKPLVLVAADVEPKVAPVVRENAERANIAVDFRLGDLFDAVRQDECFDLIVSNPPYISKEEMGTLMRDVAVYEPHLALYGGEDGLDFYRRIIHESPRHLNADGMLMLEIGDTQGESVRKLLETNGFTEVNILKDYAGNDRVAVGKVRTKETPFFE